MTQPARAATAAPHTVVARIGTYFRKRILPNWDLYLIVSARPMRWSWGRSSRR